MLCMQRLVGGHIKPGNKTWEVPMVTLFRSAHGRKGLCTPTHRGVQPHKRARAAEAADLRNVCAFALDVVGHYCLYEYWAGGRSSISSAHKNRRLSANTGATHKSR